MKTSVQPRFDGVADRIQHKREAESEHPREGSGYNPSAFLRGQRRSHGGTNLRGTEGTFS